VPGPACYGRGGQQPTVTDADLILGFLDPGFFLGGTMPLDRQKAVDAMRQHIADPLGISVEEAAWGIHRIVNENMANAARVHILEKGLDPRSFSMLAFGGAGPVHAFHVARLMHAPQLIIPGGAGVLSALGFLVSPVASEELTSLVCRLDAMDWKKVNRSLSEMETRAAGFVQGAGIDAGSLRVTRMADMRYSGQGHEITVAIPGGILSEASLPAIEAAFNAGHSTNSRFSRLAGEIGRTDRSLDGGFRPSDIAQQVGGQLVIGIGANLLLLKLDPGQSVGSDDLSNLRRFFGGESTAQPSKAIPAFEDGQ
jgi:N-methylhydantoinase A/oxoprolinase/acetone carboxylase beta subunit